MTLQEFQNKYLGKQVEYHSYGALAYNQCVDLINAYINQCLDNNTKDYTEIIGTNAKDFGTKFDRDDFEWIINTPTNVPQRGDVMVWNGNVGGGAGHVAIFLSGDANSFKSLDQNWSRVERVTLENHNYNNVIGWLRPKGQTTTPSNPTTPPSTNDRDERNKNWNWLNQVVTTTGILLDGNNPQKSVDEAIAQIKKVQKDADDNRKDRDKWFVELQSAKERIKTLEGQGSKSYLEDMKKIKDIITKAGL